MDLSSLLENERRARLAAERLLEMRQGELREANRKLAEHARSLTSEILEQRGEVEQIRSRSQSLRGEFDQTRADLARAQRAAETAETMLWSALQSVRDGFAMFDAEHRLIVANRAYLSIFDGLEVMAPGIAYADVVDLLLDEGIVDPQGPPDLWRARQKRRWDAAEPEDAVLKLWNGQFVRLLDRRMPDGGMVTLGINQTESLRTRAAIEAIPDGFVVFDQDDRMVMCNRRFLETDPGEEAIEVGASFEDILRRGLASGHYRDARGREEQWLEDRLNGYRRGDVTFEQPLRSGRWLRVIERVTPDGGRVGLHVDITESKTYQAALEAERERAEAANLAKSNFLANMSHEIRTPMNGVIGMAEMLCEGPLSAEQRVCADTIRSSGEALLDILNDILDFTKIETGHMELRSEAFDIERCVHGIVRLLQPTLHQPDLALLVDVDRATSPHVIGDEGRVRQILTNLVGNAGKFTERGHILIRVAREAPGADGTPGALEIEVEDSGIGIPADKLDHVFGAFNQVHTGRDRRFDGTGLGLAITRQLVELMGGRLSVTSQVGEGSTFHIRLPLAQAPAPFLPLRAPPGTSAWIVGPPGRATALLRHQLTALGAEARICPPGAWPEAPGETDVVFVLARPDAPPPKSGRMVEVAATVRGLKPGLSDAISLPISRQTLFDTLIGIAPTQPVSAPRPPRIAAATAPPEPGRRLRVLAAEDNRTNRIVLERMLKSAEIDLQIVVNGHEAVEAYVAAPPDLVLMDISMPTMDGREAARRIRAHEAAQGLPRVPMHAMTAHALVGDVEDSIAAGLDSHLTKPLSRERLLGLIETVRQALAPNA